MTAVVSRERATATWLTGVAGLLVLAAAVVMMVVAAPAQSQPHHAATQATTQAAVGRIRQVTVRTDSTMVHPGRPRPSMITESWRWAQASAFSRVFRLGDVGAPDGGLAVVVRFLDGQVRHERAGPGPVTCPYCSVAARGARSTTTERGPAVR